MKTKRINTVHEEQICLSCGFCCDGTLFHKAILNRGEKENLPISIKKRYFQENDKEYFKLPCTYFNNLCTIYKEKKANVCSAFRCQLLKNYSQNKISQKEAFNIVNKAKIIRQNLLDSYIEITKEHKQNTFRGLLFFLGNHSKNKSDSKFDKTKIELLNIECNIFESLLVKYFKSEKSFMELIENER